MGTRGGGTLYEECLFIKFYINALFANIPAKLNLQNHIQTLKKREYVYILSKTLKNSIKS